MADANRMRTNPHLEKEQSEGDRETVEEALAEQAEAAQTEHTGAKPRADIPGHEQQGITNQPLEEEERQQDKLPPRGERKGGAHA